MKVWEVPIVYRGQVNYLVEAQTPEEAQRKAEGWWREGRPTHDLGNEWEEIERFGTVEEVTA